MSKCPLTGYSPNSNKCSCNYCLAGRAEWQRRYRKKHPDLMRRMNLKKYGLTLEKYNEILESQHGVCAVCREVQTGHNQFNNDNSLCVDHDHSTGKVRGLLCNPCNRALGFLRDDPTRISALLDYRREYD